MAARTLRVWVASLGALVALAAMPAVSSAAAWSTAQRVLDTAQPNPDTFAVPGGKLAVASPPGLSIAFAGDPFPAPTAFPVGGGIGTRAAFRPGGTGLVTWRSGSDRYVQDRDAAGNFTGTAQKLDFGREGDVVIDAAGNATLVQRYYLSTDDLQVWNRPVGASSFAKGTSLAFAGANTISHVDLILDPDGTVLATWRQGQELKQALRPAGHPGFDAPATIGTGLSTVTPDPRVASNSAGRAVAVYYDTTGDTWRAAIREPGGSFAAPAALNQADGEVFIHPAAAVAEDGSAAAITNGLIGFSCPGGSFSGNASYSKVFAYTLPSGSTTWAAAGTAGGVSGRSVAQPVLAGGPSGQIEAAWWESTITTDQLCNGQEHPLQVAAGPLPAAQDMVFPLVFDKMLGPQSGLSGNVHYGNFGVGANVFPLSMAVNGCGDGVLAFGYDPVTSDQPAGYQADDGFYVASVVGPTTSCRSAPPPDGDGDGLPDSSDSCPGASDAAAPRNPRTGCPAEASPPDPGDGGGGDGGTPDADGDGVPDATDKCPQQVGPTASGCPLPPQPTTGNDVLSGDAGANVICGLLGNDTLRGLAGNDTLFGDACNDKQKPVTGAAAGKDGNDKLDGGDGNDSLFGAGGNDVLTGGKGNDRLFGGGGNDRLTGGPGVNTYSGGAGDDEISAKNGKKEKIDCGAGKKDKATVDKRDKVKGCEKVKRARK